MKNTTYFLILFFLLISIPASEAQELNEFEKEHFLQGKDTLNYRILYPKDFSEEKQYPIVLFLHGAGERGNDNESQLTHGADLFLKSENRKDFPAIVIFPQAPKEDYWANVEVNREVVPYEFNFRNEEEPTKALHLVMALLNSVTSEKYTDKNRIYVGGLSMGGMGTYEILSRMPETFAAAFAICGGADPVITEKYPKNFNIWIFHGEQDNVVPPELSKTMARQINTHGGNAKLSLYPDDNHNSWDSAFSEPYLLSWLFSHQKTN
ncbi:phospholipase [Salinimicrobium marinum]|uniref:Phospholipase n=1 Tax=Salinimicrobium marinum TaxID=680283 RepID=A0A918VT88_9FLAO|nr:prolyl oligopeptidase family serine peptidase [Salinimicrobium marinum]GHA26821.1 phospholipase [Salinimicrobium marinum]